MIKAIIFDLDHTLFDRYKTLALVSNKIREVFSVKPQISDEELIKAVIYADKHYIYLGWDRIQQYLQMELKIFSKPLEPDEYRSNMMKIFSKAAVPFPFTIPTLNKLKSMGYIIGLITNGQSYVQRNKLKMLKLDDIFDEVYVCGEHNTQKPDLKPFIEMSEILNLNPCEMVYVGDSPKNDLEASKNAGYTPIGVKTTGFWPFKDLEMPEFMVETIEEIPEIIRKINSCD